MLNYRKILIMITAEHLYGEHVLPPITCDELHFFTKQCNFSPICIYSLKQKFLGSMLYTSIKENCFVLLLKSYRYKQLNNILSAV